MSDRPQDREIDELQDTADVHGPRIGVSLEVQFADEEGESGKYVVVADGFELGRSIGQTEHAPEPMTAAELRNALRFTRCIVESALDAGHGEDW